MSQENVELHRRALDAWNRRDLDALLEFADAEVEITPLNVDLERGGRPYRGHDGIRKFWKDYLAIFPDFSVVCDEVRDAGEVTIARARLRARAPESEASFEQPIWQVIAWRNQKGVWWRSFRTETEALEAAGLSE
jgi:ketosteroid isomerase-like protein